MTEPEYENRFLPMDQFMPNYSEKYYMYIIDLNDLYYMDANAKVCFIFEQDKMADLFDCVQMDGDNFLAVTAEDDSTVLTINTPDSISAEMLDSLDFNKGYAEVRIDGQNFTLGKYVSDNTSYSYYFSFPPYKAAAGLGGTQLLFIFLPCWHCLQAAVWSIISPAAMSARSLSLGRNCRPLWKYRKSAGSGRQSASNHLYLLCETAVIRYCYFRG